MALFRIHKQIVGLDISARAGSVWFVNRMFGLRNHCIQIELVHYGFIPQISWDDFIHHISTNYEECSGDGSTYFIPQTK
jgi:hypothetical protein